jgi:lambda family phage minor tail protein L
MAVPVGELQSIAPSAIIELFVLELNTKMHGVSDIYRFHAGTNAVGTNGNVVWAGATYSAMPIEAEGFEYSGNGQLPRPKIRVSNIMGTISAIILSLPNGLEGAKVSRIRTMARYLDAVNFSGGTNPYGTPDSTAEFPREVYYIDRKSAENRDVVEFELACAFDLVGVRAPKRQCISNVCQWGYKSAECGYDPTSTGVAPLRAHYANNGYAEGRSINSSGVFNATYYLAVYPDVASVYTLVTANQHYRNYGIWELRVGNAGGTFNSGYYLTTYPDLNPLVYFNESDVGQTNPALDVCGKRLSSCKARFGSLAQLPFGSYPGVGAYFT